MIGGQATIIGAITRLAIHFGCQNDLVASASILLEPVSNNRLCQSVIVGVGGIEKVDSLFQRPVQHWKCVFFGHMHTKVDSAEAEPADLKPNPAEVGIFHGERSCIFISPGIIKSGICRCLLWRTFTTTLPVFRFSVNKNHAARDSKLKESTQ